VTSGMPTFGIPAAALSASATTTTKKVGPYTTTTAKIGTDTLKTRNEVQPYRFVKLPPEQQLDKVQQWLLWAVVSAERELGGGTGELKLRSVYDLFVARFPWLAKLISFECFADMVDDALSEMETLLAENKDIHAFVTGGDVAC